jgi:hypothetical protein
LTPTLGVASFTGLSLVKAAKGYTIQATSTGLAGATSSAFNVTAAAAYQLGVTTQPPPSVKVNAAFGLTISAEDRYGNVVTSEAGVVTVALLANPGRSRLCGRRTVPLSQGVAIFRGLSLNKPGMGYTLQGTDPGLVSAITDPFDVTTAKDKIQHQVLHHKRQSHRVKLPARKISVKHGLDQRRPGSMTR